MISVPTPTFSGSRNPVKSLVGTSGVGHSVLQDGRRIKHNCLFCDGMDGNLHTASTFAIDHTVRQYAIKLKDTNLLRKIGGYRSQVSQILYD